MANAELIVDARNGVGESPVWSVRHQGLFWVDIAERRLWFWSQSSGQTRSWQAPEMLACVALQAGSDDAPWGRWVAGMETGIGLLTPADDGSMGVQMLAGVTHSHEGMRFNDGRCDRQGRFWAGTMVMNMGLAATDGKLYRFDGQGRRQLDAVLDGFITPNGLAFSPDGRTMYLSDSHPNVQAIWAFDYDIDSGIPSKRRLFVDMTPMPGRPDGAAVDQDGCYWICANDGGLVHRFTPDGKLDKSLAVPVKKPAMCAFGGTKMDTLFVTSIRPGGDLSDQPLAGGVFALNPGVRGLDEPQSILTDASGTPLVSTNL
ncbi:SMP-30/gluconolactonase/LRE family protein [Curvibacter sp. CHRR-16]|uniref:SMP-30/gluconolactonase/LRE family protein n=1 Tax=Curvibacter sp. CHRR-16 TaxID=2835872 RepID=UPI001BD92688|nr:SMP-30/gluconolactonase/LRE family protein [Curvibacter sp. CHRR-16]MBT0570126.1 SMP-30/gluconolactonase/LRE family protein [Curvibacter sp. CHRR-16]